MEEKHQQSVSDEKVTASVSKEPAKDENPTIILKGPDGVAKKRHGLKLATDRVKSCGGTTPCSSPSDGPLFSSLKGPNWGKLGKDLTEAFEKNRKVEKQTF